MLVGLERVAIDNARCPGCAGKTLFRWQRGPLVLFCARCGVV